MNYLVRLLPPEEYQRLVGTEAEAVCHDLPLDAKVVVVEDAGRIVGCWTLLPIWHGEWAWIHPDYRKNGAVMRRLWGGLHGLARFLGVKRVWCGSNDDRIGHILTKRGAVKLSNTYSHYILPIAGERTTWDSQD
jgi:hypothetical protein